MAGMPVQFATTGQAFFLDPQNGSDSNDGKSPASAKKTLAAAYALLTANTNDVLYFIGGPTAAALTAALTWSKNYTHLIGLSANLPGVGQRCRVTGSASADLTVLLTISASGCIFRNLQFFNGADADVDSGAVTVSGSRNEFTNCFIAGMGHATPGARAGSYSLTVSGSENVFIDSSIGLETITRAAANADLVLTSAALRNKFVNCEIISMSDTAGHFAVAVAANSSRTVFQDCLFFNFSVNHATALTDAISTPAAGVTWYVILRGNCQFVGFTGIASTVTYVYGAGPAPNNGMFLSTAPAA